MATIDITASSIQALQQQVSGVELSDGATGRLEIFAPRVAGVCPLPLGSLLEAPGVGNLLAQHLTPTGAVLTGHGGLGSGPFQCDGFISWRVPVTQQQQGQARLSLVVALVVIVAAIGAALVALGWAVSQFRLLVETVGDAARKALPVLIIVGVGLVILGALNFRRST